MFIQSLQLILIDAASQFEQIRTSLDDWFNNLFDDLTRKFRITLENVIVIQTEIINNRKFAEENKKIDTKVLKGWKKTSPELKKH
jgi:hypothetical protein